MTKNNNILYFEGAGMSGTGSDSVPNCRIRTVFRNDSGELIYLELSGRDVTKYDKKHKRYAAYKIGDIIGYVSTCFHISDDVSIDNENENRIDLQVDEPFIYSAANILKIINEKLNSSFTELKVLHWLAGYHVFNGRNNYNAMNDFTDIPKRTAERMRIYNEVAKDYFNAIYIKNIENSPQYRRLLSKYASHSFVSMTDKTITLRSHTYKELIDDSEREKTFDVIY